MVQFSKVLFAPVHKVIANPVTLTVSGTDYPQPGQPPLGFIEKTDGIDIPGLTDIETTLPAAVARVANLTALGLTVDDLDGNNLLMNGKDWTIKSHKLFPSPNGEEDGEVFCFLEEA